MSESRPSPPLKWHGGKYYLAAKIVAMMPPHQQYVEPFFGGGTVLLAKDPANVGEIVNDLNGHLTNFWRVLQDDQLFARFHRIITAVPFSETEWKDAHQRFNTVTDKEIRMRIEVKIVVVLITITVLIGCFAVYQANSLVQQVLQGLK